MTYQILCDGDPEQIYTTGIEGQIVCGGELHIVPYSPVLGDLTAAQVGELAGAAMLLFIISYLFRYVNNVILNR
ncbi:MAG: hypothetical protein RI556_11555 [Hydrogenovibrio sp.]|uniref:hypothetical protein n=1 Tax=Hydrogenovibrio sp. TaxID=2065821 RepID=UPI0028704C37|nr:hypothetical protein [Hydrogenovibrio sp.]MDR9499803.1 hypothetical protein [Hydrogenovibrio sp.]